MSKIKAVLKACMRLFSDVYDKVLIWHHRNVEVRKFKDPQRVKLYSTVQLTKEQMQEIDDFFLANYGEKVPYTWHRHYTAFSGKFDVNYVPELLMIPEIEHFMNPDKNFVHVLGDKNFLPLIAKAANVKMPRAYLSCINGILFDSNNCIISRSEACQRYADLGEAFIKPTVGTCSGIGCAVIHIKDGINTVTGSTLMELIDGMGANFVIQERLVCHSSISRIYPNSVNTFRIITYFLNGKICHMPSIMRIGSGGRCLDNAHAGGMFIAISDDGTLHKTAYTEFKQEYTEHPDTHIPFEGYQIDLYKDALDAACRMHQCVPQLGIINWDFTIGADGEPVLIEANTQNGGIWLTQMPHGCGCFGENTAAVLQWTRDMKKLPKSKRNQ